MLICGENFSMTSQQISAPDFDLAVTLDCGQVFHWEKIAGGYVGAIGAEPIYIEQRGEMLRFAGGSEELVRDYFALDHPLAKICASFPDDPTMNEARVFCRGLRLIRQPRWECLASFITSSMKQVAHIRQMSQALRRRFGERKEIQGHTVHTFPCAKRVAECSEQDLRECALGYRAGNLLATARLVSSGAADLEGWSVLSDSELRARLCQLPGVGAKVANCVMLFAFERLRAFPIDVWIARVLQERYFPRKRKMTERQMRIFSEDYFGEHGGYAQQYLFHHARKTSRKSGVARDSSTALPRSAPLRCAQGDKEVIRHWEGSARNDKEGKARAHSRKSRVARQTARQKASGGRRVVGALKKWDTTARVPPAQRDRQAAGHDRTAKVGNEKVRGLSEVGG
jgi:N-glycosylase/DNA lyase